jgi:hypothetical protein
MRLPAELRNFIYEYVLGGHELYITYPYRGVRSRPVGNVGHSFDKTKKFVAITRTCRQARSDAKFMPFRFNTLLGMLMFFYLSWMTPA